MRSRPKRTKLFTATTIVEIRGNDEDMHQQSDDFTTASTQTMKRKHGTKSQNRMTARSEFRRQLTVCSSGEGIDLIIGLLSAMLNAWRINGLASRCMAPANALHQNVPRCSVPTHVQRDALPSTVLAWRGQAAA